MSIQAMQLALEALEIAMKTPINEYLPRECLDAITALRAALEPVTDCHEKEGDKLAPPLDRSADTGKTLDVPETNFGDMSQAVDFKEVDHIPDATKMIEPVAWVRVDRGHIDFHKHPDYLPLYTTLPQHKPLTDEEIEAIADSLPVDDLSMPTTWHLRLARAIERAHGIGGEE